MSEASNWAAIMAGGDGRRLQAFTQLIAGDERPKQFCRLFGGNSLLHAAGVFTGFAGGTIKQRGLARFSGTP